MTLHDFLLKTDVNITNNQSHLGNHLEAELASNGINIDFEKDITQVTDMELYEIGRILILAENKGKHFSSYELIDFMKKLITKYEEK